MVFPQVSWSDNRQLCFDNEQAKKLLVELKFGKVNQEKFELCQKQYSSSTALNKNYSLQITGLQADKQILKNLSEDYKQKFIASTEQLNKSETEKPSRTTWFLIGATTMTILAVIATIFVVK